MQDPRRNVTPGQAFLVSYINEAMPEQQPVRAAAYGRVQSLAPHTLPLEGQAA